MRRLRAGAGKRRYGFVSHGPRGRPGSVRLRVSQILTHCLPIVKSNYSLLHISQVDCLPIHSTCTLNTDPFPGFGTETRWCALAKKTRTEQASRFEPSRFFTTRTSGLPS